MIDDSINDLMDSEQVKTQSKQLTAIEMEKLRDFCSANRMKCVVRRSFQINFEIRIKLISQFKSNFIIIIK